MKVIYHENEQKRKEWYQKDEAKRMQRYAALTAITPTQSISHDIL